VSCREVAQPGRALELANVLSWWRCCRGLPMVGFILACSGHRHRAVAGSNPALPTNKNIKEKTFGDSLFSSLFEKMKGRRWFYAVCTRVSVQ
jgi:hypothetical protein